MNIRGGNAPIYLSNLMIRFDDVSKLKEEEAFGINGSLVDISIVKSRTARAGQVTTLVFDQELGFDPDLSLFLMLKNNKKIQGAGAYLYFEGYPDKKFSQRQFKSKLAEDDEFKKIFSELVQSVLKEMVEAGRDTIYTDYHNAADDIIDSMQLAA